MIVSPAGTGALLGREALRGLRRQPSLPVGETAAAGGWAPLPCLAVFVFIHDSTCGLSA